MGHTTHTSYLYLSFASEVGLEFPYCNSVKMRWLLQICILVVARWVCASVNVQEWRQNSGTASLVLWEK